jgi:hypothetical protein
MFDLSRNLSLRVEGGVEIEIGIALGEGGRRCWRIRLLRDSLLLRDCREENHRSRFRLLRARRTAS